jgi:purine-binding chemotaxis protein CheW
MNNQANKLVIFRLGEDLFASDVHSVERVLRYVAPTPVPDTPEYIEGVMDYLGRVVPVVNLRRRLELPANDARGDTRIVVVHVSGEWIGVVVDGVTEVAAFDPTTVTAPPRLFRGLTGQYLRGIIKLGNRLIMYLDVEHLLTSTERISLQQSAGASQ